MGKKTMKAKKKKPEIRLNIRIPEDEKADLKEVSASVKVTETMIVRHALKNALADIRRQVEAGEGVVITI